MASNLALVGAVLLCLFSAAPVAAAQSQFESRAELRAGSLHLQQDRCAFLGSELIAQQRYQEALPRVEQALRYFQAHDDTVCVASTLFSLGLVQHRLGFFSPAVRAYRQALALARQAKDRLAEGKILYRLADAYTSEGIFDNARQMLGQARVLAIEEVNPSNEALILRAFGDVELRDSLVNETGTLVITEEGRPQFAVALDYYAQALQQQIRVGDGYEALRTQLAICEAYAAWGEFGNAEPCARKARDFAESQQDVEAQALAATILGRTALARGDPAEALEHYIVARQLFGQLGDHLQIIDTLVNVSDIYIVLRQYEDALAILQQARAQAEQSGDRLRLANVQLQAGWILESFVQPELADQQYQAAVAIGRELRNEVLQAVALVRLGQTQLTLGKYQEALNSLRGAIAARRELAWDGQILYSIGIAQLGLYDYVRAEESLNQALTIASDLGRESLQAMALTRLGELRGTQGDSELALAYYEDALSLASRSLAPQDHATLLLLYGEALEQTSRPFDALSSYLQAAELWDTLIDSTGLDDFKARTASAALSTYQRAVELSIELGDKTNAFSLTERARGRVLLDMLASTRPRLRDRADADLVVNEQRLRAQLQAYQIDLRREQSKSVLERNSARVEELRGQIVNLQDEYNSILRELKVSNPEYASLRSVEPISLASLQGLIPIDTTLVSYFVTSEQTIAFLITRNSFDTRSLTVSEEQIRKALADLYKLDLDRPPTSLENLHTWLIAPLRPLIKTGQVGVIPHSVLHYVPFAALNDGISYWGDQVTIFTLPSASALPYILERANQPGSGVPLALAVGEVPGLSFLPSANGEAKAMVEHFGGTALLNGDATETAFLTRASEASIIHLAAHGQINDQSPLLSQIILIPDDQNDGALTVQDVYDLDLASARLVVLSACKTQLGSLSAGDDIVGLNRAFLYAGAPRVMASFWPVEDTTTAELMQSFYRHLNAGNSEAKALQLAQQEIRKRYPHPYYWAAFTLVGAPGTNVYSRLWILILIFVAVLSILSFIALKVYPFQLKGKDETKLTLLSAVWGCAVRMAGSGYHRRHAPHRFGGVEFQLNGHELGHLHGSRQADLPFPVRVRQELVAAGQAEPHHILPETGWVTFYIRGAEDVPAVLALFWRNYDRLAARGQPPETTAPAEPTP